MAYASEIRDAVLQYAIQGRLTEQLDSDSSTDALASTIAEDKHTLIKRKSARNDKDFPAISDDEIPFEIPSNWKWMRVGEIGIYKKGPFGSSLTKSMFIPKSDSAVKVYEQKNAIQKDATLGNYYISKSYYEEKMQGFALEPGDIIVSCAGTIGETYVLPKNMEMGIMNQALMRMNISGHINLEYFLIYFDHVLKINAQRSSQGTAIKNIPAFDIFKKMLFPVPPIEEQQRIVDRVNVLMEKLDEFSEIEQQLLALKANFPADLRGAILQAAMQGKLTEQLESDTPVEQLLKSIENGREQLLSKGAYKQDKKLRPLDDSEIPFDIPDSWSWVKLGYCSTYGQTKQKATIDEIKSDIWSLDLEDIEKTTGRLLCKQKASQRKINGDKVKFFKGNILYSKLRPYLLKILIADDDGICTPELIPFDMIGDINPRYILWVLRSPHVDYKINAVTYGVKMPRVGTDTMVNLLIPLPPIEEQQRIVERLDALLPLCNTLV